MSNPLPLQAAPVAPPLCLGCHERSIAVFVRSDANYFASPACDVCAERWVAQFGADKVDLLSVARIPIVKVIGDVTIADYARECLAGCYDAVDLQALWTLPSAITEVGRVLSERVRRSLRPSELVALRVQVTLAYSARRVSVNRARSLAS